MRANVCEPCFKSCGCKLGLGKGLKFNLATTQNRSTL